MHPYIAPLQALLKEHADKERAVSAKAYMRNQFEFFGMPMAIRRDICKQYMRAGLPSYDDLSTIITDLWNLPEREYQYFGIELLAKFRKQWKQDIISLFEFM